MKVKKLVILLGCRARINGQISRSGRLFCRGMKVEEAGREDRENRERKRRKVAREMRERKWFLGCENESRKLKQPNKSKLDFRWSSRPCACQLACGFG